MNEQNLYIPQSDEADQPDEMSNVAVLGFEVEYLQPEEIEIEALDWTEFEAIAGPRS
jgi:hypothetical protein